MARVIDQFEVSDPQLASYDTTQDISNGVVAVYVNGQRWILTTDDPPAPYQFRIVDPNTIEFGGSLNEYDKVIIDYEAV